MLVLPSGIVFLLQVEHTRDVMSEVEAVSNQYEALAVSCSQLYFALETLRDVHFLYHFSLRFFQDILAQVCVMLRRDGVARAGAPRVGVPG